MDRLEALLKQYFGYTSFRPGQAGLIEAVLNGRDVLGILPTGGGKSVCYQLPALLLPGLTIVISPLISLMHDQVDALNRRGIGAAAVTSEMPEAAQRRLFDALIRQYPAGRASAASGTKSGSVRLLYISPERLETRAFTAFASAVRISLVCIDEAHCISHWGAEFRPAYLKIRSFLESLPVRPVAAAYTATAAPRVRSDIIRLSGLINPHLFIAPFDRPNLYYEVRHPSEKWRDLLRLLSSYRGMSGIIYCLTRRSVDHLAWRLSGEGIRAARYHAGMDEDERAANQGKWLSGELPLMVATNAFGMGIDKPDVRFVIHYQMPGCIENYYQEAGRAGRDGKRSDCILLYSDEDVRINGFFIDRIRSLPLQASMRLKLDEMRRYSGGKECLRACLMRYFGDERVPAAQSCGRCSVCLKIRHRSEMPALQPGTEDPGLYRSLTALRHRLAKKRGIPAYRIFSDEALHDLSSLRPGRMTELLFMERVPVVRAIQYGADFLTEIRAWNASHR